MLLPIYANEISTEKVPACCNNDCQTELNTFDTAKNKDDISEYDYVLSLCKSILGEEAETKIIRKECGTGLHWEISRFYENNRDSKDYDMSTIQRTLDELSRRNDDTWPQTYDCKTVGRFRVYYQASTTVNIEVAEAVANVFDEIDTVFCST